MAGVPHGDGVSVPGVGTIVAAKRSLPIRQPQPCWTSTAAVLEETGGTRPKPPDRPITSEPAGLSSAGCGGEVGV